MALPGFICIGAQKSGTTWLYEMLAQNPSIWLPPLKEVHFFDELNANEETKAKRRVHLIRLARAARSGKGKGSLAKGKAKFLRSLAGDNMFTEEWYRSIFAHPANEGKVSGEITPAYLALPEETITYVKSFLPDTKFVLIVREPKARDLSQVKMKAERSHRGEMSEMTETDWVKVLEAIQRSARGNYARSIPLWQKYFGPDQLLILPFSLVRDDPQGMIRTIESFIGVMPFDGYKSLREPVHKTKPVEVPDWVVEQVTKDNEAQKEYLISAFGAEFYEKTK
jgi:hypothetical protein